MPARALVLFMRTISAGACCRYLAKLVPREVMNANDEIPQVPDDAPPAILFQLSYRANEDHRSGYRPGDKPERIVTPPTSGEAVEDAAEAGAGRTRAAAATIAVTVAANKARRIEGTLSCRPHGRNLPG